MALSSQERKALAGMALIGLFVAGAIYEIGKRNFWFEAKNTYFTEFKDADGLRLGSIVTLSGLRIGEVVALDVTEKNTIRATLSVKRSVASRVKSDSMAVSSRAFIIGDKRIDLVPGADDAPVLADRGKINGRDSTDLAEFMSGRKLAELMHYVEQLFESVNDISKEVNSVLSRYKDGQFNKTLGLIDPALENFLKLSDDMIVMTKELKKKNKELPQLVDSGAKFMGAGTKLVGQLNADFLENELARTSLSNINAMVAPVAQRQALIEHLLTNLEDLSGDLKKNPDYGKQMLDAVKELTITLKALQKTWFLEEHANDVRKEKKAKP